MTWGQVGEEEGSLGLSSQRQLSWQKHWGAKRNDSATRRLDGREGEGRETERRGGSTTERDGRHKLRWEDSQAETGGEME